jgi:hypothetical protein
MKIGMMAKRAMKKKMSIHKNMQIIPSQSGIFLLFIAPRSGEKRTVKNPEKKRIASTDLKL